MIGRADRVISAFRPLDAGRMLWGFKDVELDNIADFNLDQCGGKCGCRKQNLSTPVNTISSR
jgi:hypothetical protein